MYNYYHGNNFGVKVVTNSTVTIDKIVSWTNDNCYRQSGSYKGVYVKESKFFNELFDFDSLKSNSENLVYDLMTKIVNETNRGNPVLKNPIPLNVVEDMNAVAEFEDVNSTMDINIDQMENIGGTSQVECYLSQHREENDNNIDTFLSHRNTYYKEALPLFEEMVNICPNEYLFKEMCDILRNRHMVHLATRGINNQLINSNRMTLFGESNTNKGHR